MSTVTKTVITKPIIKPKKQKNQKKNTTTITTNSNTNSNNKGRNKKSVNSTRLISPSQFDKNCYANLLNYPFDNEACRLGYNTMIPTEVGTVVFRNPFTPLADGTFAFLVHPNLNTGTAADQPMEAASVDATTATYASFDWRNVAAYPATLVDKIRVIATGLRVTVNVPMTSPNSPVYAGAINGRSRAETLLITPELLASNLAMRQFQTGETILLTSRPQDNTAYEFNTAATGGVNTHHYPNSILAFVALGLPTTAKITVEAVLHFEYIPIQVQTGARTYFEHDSKPEPGITSSFPSLEKMWEYTSSRLNPASILDLAQTALIYGTSRNAARVLLQRPQQRMLQN